MLTKYMDALLCHQEPSEFFKALLEDDEVKDKNDYLPLLDLTSIDEGAKLASEAHMSTDVRLPYMLALLTQDMKETDKVNFLHSIDCHDWLINDVIFPAKS